MSAVDQSAVGQLALGIDVPRVPAPDGRRRKSPATQLARAIEEEAAKLATLARERALVLEHDGQGTVVDLDRWQRDHGRAA